MTFTVQGSITQDPNQFTPPVGITIRIYDRDLRTEQLLGEAILDATGRFTIQYTRDQFRRADKATADLDIRLFNPAGTPLDFTSKPRLPVFNAGPEVEIDLTLQPTAVVTPSDYERLRLLVDPILEGASPATLTPAEISFIVSDLGNEAFQSLRLQHVSLSLLKESSKLAQYTNLATAIFYGLGQELFIQKVAEATRAQPPVFDEKVVELPLDDILNLPPTQIRSLLEQALNENWIPADIREQLDEILARFAALKADQEDQIRQSWVSQVASARVVDEPTNETLIGYTIQAQYLREGADPVDLGIDITDSQGIASFDYRVPPELMESDATGTIRFTVLAQPDDDESTESLSSSDFVFSPNQSEAVNLYTAVPPVLPVDAAVIIEEQFDLSDPLKQALDTSQIRTFADLRLGGGITQILQDSNPTLADTPEVKRLEAQSNLYALSAHLPPDEAIALNDKLNDKGFTRFEAIAAKTRQQFQHEMADSIDVAELQRLYNTSVLKGRRIDNLYVDTVKNRYNFSANGSNGDSAEPVADPRTRCDCEDCASALSPGAYLAELLGYVQKHVVKAGTFTPITLEELETLFYQPLGELPISCAATQTPVRQVRLCIEVLLRYLTDTAEIPNAAEYRTTAYSAILRQLGTSLGELRDAETDEARQTLANRLSVPAANLSDLILDASLPLTNANALSEQSLEARFGLSATVELNGSGFVLSDPLPKLEQPPQRSRLAQLRSQYLRNLWLQQDFPVDDYSNSALPIIDPDIIGPDDFRTPLTSLGERAFKIWVTRRDMLDAEIAKLYAVPTSDIPSLLAVLRNKIAYRDISGTATETTPWSSDVTVEELLDWQTQITQGQNQDAYEQWLSEHYLDSESFTRLVDIARQASTEDALESELWEDAIAILAQVQKRSLFEVWIAEENGANIHLDPQAFWISLTEPTEGEWSSQIQSDQPLIDPDERTPKAYLESTLFRPAVLEIWNARQQVLESKRQEIQTALETNGLASALQTALDNPPAPDAADWFSYLDSLDAQLLDRDAQARAENDIQTKLFMDVDAFKTLMLAKAESVASGTLDAVDAVVVILTTAYKRKALFADWLREEANRPYWRILKAKLPRWRASAAKRQAWQQALKQRSQQPILDPDLVKPEDLSKVQPGSPHLTLWQQRLRAINTELSAIRSADVSSFEAFSANLLEQYLGLSSNQLIELNAQEEQGQKITQRIEQFALSRRSYLYLLQIAQRVEAGKEVAADMWQQVHDIVLQSWKRRQFGQWQREEQAAAISLSPIYFQRVPREFGSVPAEESAVSQWRAERRDRRSWEKTLKSRLDQQAAMNTAHEELIGEVEESTLPQLRDFLINATNVPESTLDTKAKGLTDRLLVDMLTSGCQTTTRISQAIETLQNLIFSIRTGQLDLGENNSFELDAENFENEWRWLGSYATWKAAKAVFLYPENLLLPTFKRHQTLAFTQITKNVRANKSLASVEQAGNEYFRHLQDVCSLNIKATCWGRTPIAQAHSFVIQDEQNAERDYIDLLYLFAQPENSNQIYWSTYNPVGEEYAPLPYAQSFWQKLNLDQSDIKIEDIIGVVPYQEVLCLFIYTMTDEGRSLGLLRYSLQEQKWSEVNILGIPETSGQFRVTILQKKPKNTSILESEETLSLENEGSPSLICAVKGEWHRHDFYNKNSDLKITKQGDSYDTYLYFNRLNSKGDSLELDKWKLLGTLDLVNFDLVDLISLEYRNSIFTIINTKLSTSVYCKTFVVHAESLKISLEEFPGDVESLIKYRSLLAEKSWIEHLTYAHADHTNTGVVKYYEEKLRDIDQEIFQLSPEAVDSYDKWEDGHQAESWQTLDKVTAAYWWPELSGSLSGLFIFHQSTQKQNKYSILKKWSDSSIELFKQQKLHEFEAFTGDYDFPSTRVTNQDIPVSIAKHGGASWPEPSRILVYNSGNLGKASLAGATALTLKAQDTQRVVHAARNLTPKLSSVKNSSRGERKREVPIPIFGLFSLNEHEDRKNWLLVNTGRNRTPLSNSIYLDEAYFFLPLFFAISLKEIGQYEQALDWLRTIYNYSLPESIRESAYLLQKDEFLEANLESEESFFVDPINPHAIATNRRNAYTQFTLFTVIRCLLDFADSEFTQDTAESISRARTLYTTATEILAIPELQQIENVCDKLRQSLVSEINTIASNLDDSQYSLWQEWQPVWQATLKKLEKIEHFNLLKPRVDEILQALRSNEDIETRLRSAYAVVQDEEVASTKTPLKEHLDEHQWRYETGLKLAAENSEIDNKASRLSKLLRKASTNGSDDGGTNADSSFEQVSIEYAPSLTYGFCIPPNPTADALRLRAELNLYKIRNCMNIAGMKRELEPYAAPIDVQSSLPSIGAGGQINLPGLNRIRPTLYRYPVLIERTKQLVNLAQQIESSMLSAIQGKYQEAYSLLKAKQEMQLAKAGIKLQDLRLNEAEGGVQLAELQQERSAIQAETYQDWISVGRIQAEIDLLEAYKELESLQLKASDARVAARIGQIAVTAATAPSGAALGVASFFGVLALMEEAANRAVIQEQRNISELSFRVGFERRLQEWNLQLELSRQDESISNQQITLAEDRVRIVGQERRISEIQTDQADEVINFLQNKFTNLDLYEWMSGVLESVYRYFLQQATSMAKLAENQLAFERQQIPPQFIQSDYFEAPREGGTTTTEESNIDRRGLTGSARLLQDIYKLDQYAFETNQRKLQLTETISLSQLDPFAFQRFRESGNLIFETPMSLFDRRFPGNYLRLIRQVRISVIALVPPTRGISATLTSAGISRVAIQGSVFQTTVIRRDPEIVQFTSPINSNGLFELNPQTEMLNPFEGNGVDTRWSFDLPKASNPFDFNTIADVLITIDYTALHSEDYRQQVLQQLDPSISGDRAFSFRNEFADAWYDLHNPEQTATPGTVKFTTRRADFPPNINDLTLSNIRLYFALKEATPWPQGQAIALSTNNQEGSPIPDEKGIARFPLIQLSSADQEWQLAIPENAEVQRLFSDNLIDEILLIVTYDGELPA
ncbi:MAG: hypothetical protein F6J95_027900 [Leptolyngbya sp. SIO1E4]|nr:hypothetical protein [Leptolyngbya sp. SIO1E4]